MKKRIFTLLCCLSLTVGLFFVQSPAASAAYYDSTDYVAPVALCYFKAAGFNFDFEGGSSAFVYEFMNCVFDAFLSDYYWWHDEAPLPFPEWLGGYPDSSAILDDVMYEVDPEVGLLVGLPENLCNKFAEVAQWFAGDLGLSAGGPAFREQFFEDVPFFVTYSLSEDYAPVSMLPDSDGWAALSVSGSSWTPDSPGYLWNYVVSDHYSGDLVVADVMRGYPVPVSPSLSDVITPDMVGGVMDGVISILPVVLLALVGFIALRKGLAFILGILRNA